MVRLTFRASRGRSSLRGPCKREYHERGKIGLFPQPARPFDRRGASRDDPLAPSVTRQRFRPAPPHERSRARDRFILVPARFAETGNNQIQPTERNKINLRGCREPHVSRLHLFSRKLCRLLICGDVVISVLGRKHEREESRRVARARARSREYRFLILVFSSLQPSRHAGIAVS